MWAGMRGGSLYEKAREVAVVVGKIIHDPQSGDCYFVRFEV